MKLPCLLLVTFHQLTPILISDIFDFITTNSLLSLLFGSSFLPSDGVINFFFHSFSTLELYILYLFLAIALEFYPAYMSLNYFRFKKVSTLFLVLSHSCVSA